MITPRSSTTRMATTRRYLMCPPTYFEVAYSINPWMRLDEVIDKDTAYAQWATLRELYLELGHVVELIEPVAGLPDMVFAANGGLVIDGRAIGSNFVHKERQPEAATYLDWFRRSGIAARAAARVMEGEGDYRLAADWILAGFGFRSDPRAASEVQEYFGRPVINLELVDPRYYHLDTALAVFSDTEIGYLPEAFSPGSQAVIERLFPDAIKASLQDAEAFGLNAVSDGCHVVVAAGAAGLIKQLTDRGFVPCPVDLSEFRKAGGGAKCCTLELRL